MKEKKSDTSSIVITTDLDKPLATKHNFSLKTKSMRPMKSMARRKSIRPQDLKIGKWGHYILKKIKA